MTTDRQLKEIAHTERLEHEKECREPGGPVYSLRGDVAELKSWVKGIGIAIVILQLFSTGSTVAKLFAPTVSSAHAEVRGP
jgi:hypothetical protein